MRLTSTLRHALVFGTAALVLVSTGGCKKKKKDDSKLTIKVQTTGAAAALNEDQQPGFAMTAGAAAGNLSFTPTSYKLWISTIVLQNDAGGSNQFYTCDSSAADCEVDFADSASVAAFEAKLSGININPGTYTKVWLSCTPTSGGYTSFKGHVKLGDGTTYYTADKSTNGGSPLTTDSTKEGYLKISYTGGSCGLTMPLSKTLDVADNPDTNEDSQGVKPGKTVTMTIFSNLVQVAYYGKDISGGMGGCAIDDGKAEGPGFCVNYPSVFPYFGETKPTVEYYRVANALHQETTLEEADVNVITKVILDEAGTPFWASMGAVYTENTPNYADGEKGISGYANSVTKFAVNADASLTIKSMDYGFTAFKRAEHTGSVTGEAISNGAGTGTGTTYYYHAFPYTP